MGIAVELGPEGVARCIREAGVGFMMAPRYHPAMAAVVPVRRSLKVMFCSLANSTVTRVAKDCYPSSMAGAENSSRRTGAASASRTNQASAVTCACAALQSSKIHWSACGVQMAWLVVDHMLHACVCVTPSHTMPC